MDVIIYNRISTDNKDQDPESNLGVCKDYCKYEKHNIIDIIIDKGVSGSVPYNERKEAQRIDNHISDYNLMGKELGIVSFSIDRFTREHPVDALMVKRTLNKKGVPLFSATENIFNEDSEFSLPMQFMILWFNYYFLLQHSKKVKAGNEKRKQEGKHLGRALIKKTIGVGKNKTYIYYTEEELNNIRMIIKELTKKYTYRKIVEIMKNKYSVNISTGYISKLINNK